MNPICNRAPGCVSRFRAPLPAEVHEVKRALLNISLLLLLLVLLSGCRSRQANTGASIEFSRVPIRDDKGSDTIDIIEGRVTGARPGQQIVLYARSGTWWVQPLVNEPFTKIQPDSTWTNSTHLGTEYAALLVDQGYRPPATAEVLPKEGSGVVAVAIANSDAASAAVSRILRFSGYEWRVRSAPSSRGGANNYSPDNAWTDESGALSPAPSHSEKFRRLDMCGSEPHEKLRVRIVLLRRAGYLSSGACCRLWHVHLGLCGNRPEPLRNGHRDRPMG